MFPNFHPWGVYNRIVYRFRPNGDRHDQSIMECMFLVAVRRASGRRPRRSTGSGWTTTGPTRPSWACSARVFNQDVYNLPKVQAGLETGAIDRVTFANYQETKPRHFHRLLEAWLLANDDQVAMREPATESVAWAPSTGSVGLSVRLPMPVATKRAL